MGDPGAPKITFHLQNDGMNDVNVSVRDDRDMSWIYSNMPLNEGNSLDISIWADQDGKGMATWQCLDSNGNTYGPFSHTGISEGDTLSCLS